MKWLFTDFDGTLSNSKETYSQITNEDLQFVKNWQKAGNKLIIATGRPFCTISNFVKTKYDLHPDFFITNTGAAIYDKNGEALFLNYLTDKTKQIVLSFLKEHSPELRSAAYALKDEENFFFNKDWNEEKQKFFLSINYQEHPLDFTDNKPVHCFKLRAGSHLWNKLLNQLEENKCEIYTVINMIKDYASSEVHDINTSKGKAIEFLQKKYNINKNDIIVAGDDLNDLTMFEKFYDNSFVVDQTHNNHLKDKAKYRISKLCEIADKQSC